MGLFSRKSETPSTSVPVGKLPETMPARLPATDPRTRGHETDYQSSRGSWRKKS